MAALTSFTCSLESVTIFQCASNVSAERYLAKQLAPHMWFLWIPTSRKLLLQLAMVRVRPINCLHRQRWIINIWCFIGYLLFFYLWNICSFCRALRSFVQFWEKSGAAADFTVQMALIKDPGILCCNCRCNSKIFSFVLPEKCPSCYARLGNSDVFPFRWVFDFLIHRNEFLLEYVWTHFNKIRFNNRVCN